MIALQSDCLLFQLASGESIPCSPEMISVELVGDSDGQLDPEMLRHAAASVFHYFKVELERQTVSIGEFSLALEKALRNLGLTIRADDSKRARRKSSKPTSACSRVNPTAASNSFSSRACATNCGRNSASHRA